jgi:hypothetical protein
VTTLRAAYLAALVCAAVAGVLLALRRREHVPAAVALSLLSVLNLAQVVTGAPGPPAIVHLDRAVWLSAAAVVPGLAIKVFLSPRLRRPALACVVGASVLAFVVLAVVYPPPAQVVLQRFYLAVDLAGLAIATASIVTWVWWAKGRASLSSAQAVAAGLVLLDLAILLAPYSPWHGSLFVSSFDMVRGAILVFFSAVTIVEVILWRFSPDS